MLEILGGRAIHPINVTVGGFYSAPRRDHLQALLPDLEWGLQAAVDTLHVVAGLDFPALELDYEQVCLKHPCEFPMNEGHVVSSSGLDIPVEDYARHFREQHAKHSNALRSVMLPGEKSYLVGPLARVNLCFDQLSPLAKREAEACKIAWPIRNNFQSIVARAVELIDAYEEAIAIVKAYHREPTESRVRFTPRAGEGCHATECCAACSTTAIASATTA